MLPVVLLLLAFPINIGSAVVNCAAPVVLFVRPSVKEELAPFKYISSGLPFEFTIFIVAMPYRGLSAAEKFGESCVVVQYDDKILFEILLFHNKLAVVKAMLKVSKVEIAAPAPSASETTKT